MIQEEFDKKIFNIAEKKRIQFFKESKLEPPKKKSPAKKDDLFYLADLFGLRQKEKLWLAYQREISGGVPIEEIFWKFLWQVKTLNLIKKGEGQSLHPFVFRKNEKAAGLFTEAELRGLSGQLIELYHQNRYGLADLGIGLEKIILKL